MKVTDAITRAYDKTNRAVTMCVMQDTVLIDSHASIFTETGKATGEIGSRLPMWLTHCTNSGLE